MNRGSRCDAWFAGCSCLTQRSPLEYPIVRGVSARTVVLQGKETAIARTITLLTPAQRLACISIPAHLSERDIAYHYTLSDADKARILRHRRAANRLGFAVQLCVLRFPGRTLTDIPEVPPRVLAFIAEQIGVPANAYAQYGQRENTLYEHLDELRQECGFQNPTFAHLLMLGRVLLPMALENEQVSGLITAALAWLRAQHIIAPPMPTVEKLVWSVRRQAERQVLAWLTAPLSPQQRDQLDQLLRVMPEKSVSRLTWLREPAGEASAKSLRHILDRIEALRGLALPPLSPEVHALRLAQLARQGAQYGAQPLVAFPPARRYALLLPYLDHLEREWIDKALTMFGDLVGELLHKGDQAQQQQLHRNSRTMNTHLHTLNTVSRAYLGAKAAQEDIVAAIEALISDAVLAATIKQVDDLLRPPDLNSLDLIETRYKRLRKVFLDVVRLIPFHSVRKQDPILQALAHVQVLASFNLRVTSTKQTVRGTAYHAPLLHVPDDWLRYVLPGGGTINPNYYEAAAFERLKVRLRSGDISVPGSLRHRAFTDDLLPEPAWEEMVAQHETQLAVTEDVEAYLAEAATEITTRIERLKASVGTGGLTIDDKGVLHLAPLDEAVPKDALASRRHVYALLPRMSIADIIIEVDGWTGCLDAFTHQTTGRPAERDDKLKLVAAIMGMGMNLGLSSLAESTPYTYRQMAWAADWHLREETLLAAQVILDNFVLHQPFARSWGDGTSSSSDGMRVKVGVGAANARKNAEHFGKKERGVTIYTHKADVYVPFYKPEVISPNDREALYVIDALLHHESDLSLREHYTDTHGFTHHVFALCKLLGLRFAPRIADVLGQRLYVIAPLADYGPLKGRIKGKINPQRIRDHWKEFGRIAGSISHGTASAPLLMGKLAGYPQKNQVACALEDVGKIEKTLFILDYLCDEQLRRRILEGLNKGEAVHSLARKVFFGRQGEFWEQTIEDQIHRASCLHFLIGVIAAWNTVYVTKAVNARQDSGHPIPTEHLPHISPLGWEHINFIGKYGFDFRAVRPLNQLRPLRTEEEIATDAEEAV